MAHLKTRLLSFLNDYPRATHYWVAFSGGPDSHALLHAMAELRRGEGLVVGAVHVNHQLQREAAQWAAHCRAEAQRLGLPYVCLQTDARAAPGESPEAAAREARYRVLAQWLGEDQVVMSAHHRDDQAETLMLQLLRGGGVRGLAAMPACSRLGAGWLLRPLLTSGRDELLQYAGQHELAYILDPSNADTAMDRNYLRHQVMPVLKTRWPSAARTLARSAGHAADAALLLETCGQRDMDVCAGRVAGTLSAKAVIGLNKARARNLLRSWLQGSGMTPPPAAMLEEILTGVCQAGSDREPRVAWNGGEIRRYQDDLFALAALPRHDAAQRISWDPRRPLGLEHAGGVLYATNLQGQGVRSPGRSDVLEVCFRQGGERIRPVSRRHRHHLKKLFQDRGIPPWERERVPLIHLNGELAAVAGLWVDSRYRAHSGEPGLVLRWSRWRDAQP